MISKFLEEGEEEEENDRNAIKGTEQTSVEPTKEQSLILSVKIPFSCDRGEDFGIRQAKQRIKRLWFFFWWKNEEI